MKKGVTRLAVILALVVGLLAATAPVGAGSFDVRYWSGYTDNYETKWSWSAQMDGGAVSPARLASRKICSYRWGQYSPCASDSGGDWYTYLFHSSIYANSYCQQWYATGLNNAYMDCWYDRG